MDLYVKNTKVLQCKRLIYKYDSEKRIERCVKDYEFDLYVNESEDEIRTMIIDGQKYEIQKNMLVCRKPGQQVCSWGNFNCYMLTVDFEDSVGLGPEEYRRHRTGEPQRYRDDLLDMLPAAFTPVHAQEILRIMENMLEVSYPNPRNREMQELYLAEFLHLLAVESLYHRRIQNPPQRSVITESCNYIQSNNKCDITLAALGEKAHLSPTYFSRLFKQEVGSSPIEYLLKTRFDNARVLLLETDYSVKSISNLCGYEDESFFIASFKKRYGLTPQGYRTEKG